MASWLHPEKKSNQNQVPPLQQKSRIPVRVTRLSREGNGRPSSENGAYNKAQLERISVSNLQNKRPSRIPIPMDDRKNKVKVKVNLSKNVKTTRGEKFLGKNSVRGINLQKLKKNTARRGQSPLLQLQLNMAVIFALRKPSQMSGDVYHDNLHPLRQSRNRLI